MKRKIMRLALIIANKIRKFYWKIARPTRYGVKALIIHPQNSQQILLVRQSYGDTRRYTLPGGGYAPTRETPEIALRREIKEETGIDLVSPLLHLVNIVSEAEGKKDNLSIMKATATSETVILNSELNDFIWVNMDLQNLPKSMLVSNFVREAINAASRNA